MALTNAEKQAAWRARQKEEIAQLRTGASSQEEAAKTPDRGLCPPPLPTNVRKARSNQYGGAPVIPGDGRQIIGGSEDQGWIFLPPAVPKAEVAKKDFGDRMREARIAAGLSQAEVATALFGPGQVYVKRYINWEIGRSPMALEVIPVFAQLVRTDCNFLFS